MVKTRINKERYKVHLECLPFARLRFILKMIYS